MAHVQWKETAPGRFERAQDCYETFMTAWGTSVAPFGKEEVMVNVALDFDTSTQREDLIEVFTNAWIAMRYQRPSIASFYKDAKCIYLTSDVDSWLKETFIVSSGSAEEVFPTLPIALRPTIRLFPESKQVMISHRHHRTDAIGTALLLNALLELVANPQQVTFGDEISRLSPPFESLAKLPAEPDLELVKAESQRFMSMFPPGIGLPTENATQPPSDPAFETIMFSESETTALVQACRKIGHTVTPVTHVAIIEAAEQLAGETSDYTGLCISNIRPRFGPEGDDYSIGLSFGQFARLKQGSFLERVNAMQQAYSAVRPENVNMDTAKAAFSVLAQAFSQPPPVPMTAVKLSAYGVLDGYIKQSYGDLKIRRYAPMTNGMSPGIMSSTFTFNGCLTNFASYNRTYYKPEFVRSFLEIFKERLFKGLGI